MKRFFAILSLLFLGLSVMAQDVTLKVSGMLLTRYRYTANSINDRRLASDHHNFLMFDLQMSLRF
ncbi:MAG: hypothetical protein IJK19_00820 [Bacteroidales bacterium]|nr:hypothetical protein [Bacteroidales bacterium]